MNHCYQGLFVKYPESQETRLVKKEKITALADVDFRGATGS